MLVYGVRYWYGLWMYVIVYLSDDSKLTLFVFFLIEGFSHVNFSFDRSIRSYELSLLDKWTAILNKNEINSMNIYQLTLIFYFIQVLLYDYLRLSPPNRVWRLLYVIQAHNFDILLLLFWWHHTHISTLGAFCPSFFLAHVFSSSHFILICIYCQ